MNYKRTATTMFLLCLYVLLAGQNINIIPQPQKVEMKEGYFVLNEKTPIYFNNQQLKFIADYTSATINALNRLQLHVNSQDGTQSNAKSINLILDTKINTAKEGYVLSVSSKEISIKASTSQGLFYGVQSLFQLIPINGDRKVPSLLIKDEPRFSWRGLMLDVRRQFFTFDEVKSLIDQMVTYKFNILHLHLTDDQGWRIEIKKLPELTKVGAWRVPRTGLWWERECPKEGEEATYGGFYTQEEIKDLIKYTTKRYVNILLSL
ncbi:MAG: family 20 glycosylhydrolase [Bacteroidales bacterium]